MAEEGGFYLGNLFMHKEHLENASLSTDMSGPLTNTAGCDRTP